MEIKQLRTLEQHIDYVKSLAPKDFCKLINEDIHDFTDLETDALKFHQVYKYTKHQKQPLTEEMVFNEISKPNPKNCVGSMSTINYQEHFAAWREAEKKVIFEGWNKICEDDVEYYENKLGNLEFRNNVIEFTRSDGYMFELKTLHDLAEATNGELRTKNLTI